MKKKIVAFSGSLREKSFNTRLLKAAQNLSKEMFDIEIIDYSELPLFNEDLESDFPKSIKEIKTKIEQSDGVIFSTPEYNRSIPGVLKNMIDWMSRPYGENSFKNKTALILGASVSPLGTALAQKDLKNVLLYLDMNVIGQPEFYLASAYDKFSESGELVDQGSIELLTQCLNELSNRIA